MYLYCRVLVSAELRLPSKCRMFLRASSCQHVPSFASSSPGPAETIPQNPFVEEWLQLATSCRTFGQETSIQPGLASWSRVALLNSSVEICLLQERHPHTLLLSSLSLVVLPPSLVRASLLCARCDTLRDPCFRPPGGLKVQYSLDPLLRMRLPQCCSSFGLKWR